MAEAVIVSSRHCRRSDTEVYKLECYKRHFSGLAVKRCHYSGAELRSLWGPNSHLNDDLYEQVCTDIERYLDGKIVDQERTFYKMVGNILLEEEWNIAYLKNFVYNDTPQAIPAFLGEEAYKQDGTYVGFRLKVDNQRHPGYKVTEIFWRSAVGN